MSNNFCIIKGTVMKKISVIALTALLGTLGGCATAPVPVAPRVVDQEPLLVGKPIDQRISEVHSSIDDQLFLLDKVQHGGKFGNYGVVQHNNNLDARVGSSKTIPQAYAHPEVKLDTVVAQNKVKKIEWKDNSLNALLGNFSKALGYQLVIKTGQLSDKNINFSAENITLNQALNKLGQEIAPFAHLMVIDSNKTVNVIYKK
jgi:hypothetical protein